MGVQSEQRRKAAAQGLKQHTQALHRAAVLPRAAQGEQHEAQPLGHAMLVQPFHGYASPPRCWRRRRARRSARRRRRPREHHRTHNGARVRRAPLCRQRQRHCRRRGKPPQARRRHRRLQCHGHRLWQRAEDGGNGRHCVRRGRKRCGDALQASLHEAHHARRAGGTCTTRHGAEQRGRNGPACARATIVQRSVVTTVLRAGRAGREHQQLPRCGRQQQLAQQRAGVAVGERRRLECRRSVPRRERYHRVRGQLRVAPCCHLLGTQRKQRGRLSGAGHARDVGELRLQRLGGLRATEQSACNSVHGERENSTVVREIAA